MSRPEKYSIECSEGCVEIQGYLSIREAFDFLSYYEREGFTCLTPGDQNSCMLLTKHDFTKPSHPEKPHCSEDYWAIDEIMMWKGKCEKLQAKVIDLEILIKSFLPSNLPEDSDGMATPKQV